MRDGDQFGSFLGPTVFRSKVRTDGLHDCILHIGKVFAQLLSLGVDKASFREPKRGDRYQSEEKPGFYCGGSLGTELLGSLGTELFSGG